MLLGLLTAWQAWSVRSALQGARLELESVAKQVDADNLGAAKSAARRAADAAARADFHAHTPVWWASQYLPLLGDDVTAVRKVSASVYDLTDGVVQPMIEAGLRPSDFRPRDGRMAIKPIRRAGRLLDDAAPRVDGAQLAMGDLRTSGLLGALQEPVEELKAMIAEAAGLTSAGAIATDLLPEMLGVDEPRQYVVVFQNNAEVRATGGLAGAFGVLTADDGGLTMERTFFPAALENGEPVAPLTKQERLLYGEGLAVFARNINFTPDFPRSAELLSAFWDRSGRPPLDGVLSLDPVALSYLIDYTGPIALEDGTTLTSDNAVEVLLRDSYEEPDPQAQNRFFSEAAFAIFDAVLDAGGSPEAFIRAVSRGFDERRISVWSAHPEEQRVLAGEDAANELPQGRDKAEVGIYLNDAAADKLSYYLHSDISVRPESCSSDGVQKIIVDVRLRSTAPRGGLPDYVIGGGVPGAPPGTMRNTLDLFVPTGGRIDEVTLEGQEAVASDARLGNRPVSSTTVDLRPGQSKKLRYVVYSGAGQEGEIRVLSTPLADGTGGEAFVDSGCD